jgi:cold shock protein
MPTGRLKVFNADRNFGFVTTEDEAEDIFFHAEALKGEANPGDLVEFEVREDESGEKTAADVTVVKAAVGASLVGRTLSQPPTWDQLEERDRARRQARRRRR